MTTRGLSTHEVRELLRNSPPTKPVLVEGYASLFGRQPLSAATKEVLIRDIDRHLATLPQDTECTWQPPRLEPLHGTPAPTTRRPAPTQIPPAPPIQPTQPIVPAGPTPEQLMEQFRRDQDVQMVNRINALIQQWNTAPTAEAKNLIKIQVDGFKTLINDPNVRNQIPDLPEQTESTTPPTTPPTPPPATPPATPPIPPAKKKSWFDRLDEWAGAPKRKKD